MELEFRRQTRLRTKLSERARLVDLDLLDFVPAVSPRIGKDITERPEHLPELADLFDRIERGEVVRALVSYPPQMGKTNLLAHGIARAIARHPEWPFIYTSYDQERVAAVSRQIRDLARRLDVDIRDDAAAVHAWLTPEDGGLRARGVGQGIAGYPAKVAVVDDAFGKREDAESALHRQKVHDWFTGDLLARTHPDSSIIVLGTRWHPDDLIGRLETELDPVSKTGVRSYEVVNRPAILRDGRPLWHRRPLDFLARVKARNDYDWQSLWMGEPRARGESVFRGVRFYDKLPAAFAIGKGTDLAYTESKRACFSAGVVMLADGPDPLTARYYVTDVRRAQVEAPEFAAELAAVDLYWPGPWHWYFSTSEKGSAQLLSLAGVDVRGALARVAKFVRAQGLAAAWNAGRVFVPRTLAAALGSRARPGDEKKQPPWLKAFVDEVGSFTGVSDRSSDQVDAAVSAHASLYNAKVDDGKKDEPRSFVSYDFDAVG